MGRVLPTLHKRRATLASAAAQRRVLHELELQRGFDEMVADTNVGSLQPTTAEVFQINVGKRCNQTCRHCHVDAGPDRDEVMTDAVVDRCLEVLALGGFSTLDVTGGAPELHPRFSEIVAHARALNLHVIDRSNLTVLLLPNYSHLPGFLAEHGVEVVASLPHYRARQTDAQRGAGVFEESLEALRTLNALGYGAADGRLQLSLVTNPVGAFLPGNQAALERDWKRELDRRYGIRFNRLLTITNMPIARYLEWLEESGNLHAYMRRLVDAFNPAAAASVMCRNTLSVGWDGTLYDCDFNQMLELPVAEAAPRTIFNFDRHALDQRAIVTGPHCFGCTAGAGSSCGGATVDEQAA
jgi:radical SAM/Cys-rich protein